MSHAIKKTTNSTNRAVIAWSIVLTLLLGSLFGTVGVLNTELYSAAGFVRSYLQALAEHDTNGALNMPGVTIPPELSAEQRALLTPDALGALTDIEITNHVAESNGTSRVTARYTLSARDSEKTASTQRGQSDFFVRQTVPRFGVLTGWEFVESPLAMLSVTIRHAGSFIAGKTAVTIAEASRYGAHENYPVLVPNLYLLSHSSPYLQAKPISAVLTQSGKKQSATVTVEPAKNFITAVQKSINTQIIQCASQTLLYPKECPFGKEIVDRIVSDPVWSIVSYPAITLEGGEKTWRVPVTTGTAHLSVDVLSLFDGSRQTVSEDVPFTVEYAVVLANDNSITVTMK